MTSPCTGRTNCASPAPQRITFGIGSDFSASSTSEASTLSSCAPVVFARATKTSPFAPARRSSLSTATPCFFAKPATACAGAEVDGPATSDSRSWAAAATSAIDTARRRGVAKMRMPFPETSCTLASPASSVAPNASESARSDFGGSSSVRSSTSSVARFSGTGHGEAEALPRFVVGLRYRAREGAHAADVGGALGDRDGAARVEQVEGMRAFEHHLVSGQHALGFDQPLCFAFEVLEQIELQLDV